MIPALEVIDMDVNIINPFCAMGGFLTECTNYHKYDSIVTSGVRLCNGENYTDKAGVSDYVYSPANCYS
jgi:hypothetical protein